METNDPIIRLLEMLEHPEAYSEQEIFSLIHHDEATRQAYEWMVAARQGYRQKEAERPADVEAAWQRFQEAHPQPLPKGGCVKMKGEFFPRVGKAFPILWEKSFPRVGKSNTTRRVSPLSILTHPLINNGICDLKFP